MLPEYLPKNLNTKSTGRGNCLYRYFLYLSFWGGTLATWKAYMKFPFTVCELNVSVLVRVNPKNVVSFLHLDLTEHINQHVANSCYSHS